MGMCEQAALGMVDLGRWGGVGWAAEIPEGSLSDTEFQRYKNPAGSWG